MVQLITKENKAEFIISLNHYSIFDSKVILDCSTITQKIIRVSVIGIISDPDIKMFSLSVKFKNLPDDITSLTFVKNNSFKNRLAYKVYFEESYFPKLKTLKLSHAYLNMPINEDIFPKLTTLYISGLSFDYVTLDIGEKLKTLELNGINNPDLESDTLKKLRLRNSTVNLDNFPNTEIEVYSGLVSFKKDLRVIIKANVTITAKSEMGYNKSGDILLDENCADKVYYCLSSSICGNNIYISKEVTRDLVIDTSQILLNKSNKEKNFVVRNNKYFMLTGDNTVRHSIRFEENVKNPPDLCEYAEYFKSITISLMDEDLFTKDYLLETNYYKCQDKIKLIFKTYYESNVFNKIKNNFKYRIPDNIDVGELKDDTLPAYSCRQKSAKK